MVSNIFLCSPLLGEDSHFDSYFSDGLKPPMRSLRSPFQIKGSDLLQLFRTIEEANTRCDMVTGDTTSDFISIYLEHWNSKQPVLGFK